MGVESLFANFQKHLAGATLVGHRTSEGYGSAEFGGVRCMLKSVAKLAGTHNWLFRVGLESGGVESVFPLRGEVQWAGSIPVVVLTDVMLPRGGIVSAKVLIDKEHDAFSGVWSSNQTHGHLFGRIEEAPTPTHSQRFVIERSSEFLREWWTGERWTEDYAQAKWYQREPDASRESHDEEARSCFYPSGEVESG
jgi:hypothetical protein